MFYGLVDVFEFWEYEVMCYDKNSNSGVLFVQYVNLFLKLKQESSGYLSWVQSEEDKTDTSRTAGAQRELRLTRHPFPKLWGKGFSQN